ncbi:MAG: penicillin acylase family protein, partial [Candidatus Eisenbacteria bacterium]
EEFDARTMHVSRGIRPRAGDGLARDARDAAGSNSWVVSGARTRSGRPLLANDPHMALRVPTIWHRQSLAFSGVTVTGVTLPGVPGVVCGTNGAVAWGVTNPSLDAIDLVRCVPADAETTTYFGPAGREPFMTRREVIAVKGAAAETLDVKTTRFGPVLGPSRAPGGGLLAVQWTALDPRTVDTDLYAIDRAASLAEFLVALDDYRGPQMSFIAADTAGHIGWKVGGLLPRRAGGPFDRPRDARDADAAWTGFLAGAEAPALFDPPAGILFTANQRVLGGTGWDVMGGRVAAPWRARRIARVLAAADTARLDVAAMVALQNDLDASYLEPTARALGTALAGEAAGDTLARVRAILAAWDRRADSTSVAHAYLVQARGALHELLLEPLIAPCVAADSDFDYTDALVDEVARRLLAERPAHLLAPRFADYDALLREAARRAAARLGARVPGTPFDRVTWGRVNRADIVHPLGAISPLLGRVLDMPRVALSGGANVVRVARPRHGATMRLVVDLADPAASRFALAGGQSGHFRSPHYGDQFATWVAGGTTSLAPGPPAGSITLKAPAPRGP